jgi:hypothetical protein
LAFHTANGNALLLAWKKGLFIVFLRIIALVTHPAWTISAMSGGCGSKKASNAVISTGILLLVFLLQIILWLVSRYTCRRA